MRIPGIACVPLLACAVTASSADVPRATDVAVFREAAIHFHADSAGRFAVPGVAVEESGRVARTEANLPESPAACRVKALLTIHPVPKDERTMFDRWDRAGNIRLSVEGAPDLEIVRFVTSYGGRTDHEVDVSELLPLLRGRRTLRAFIDTWVSPAWRVDCTLRYEPDTTYDAPSWSAPVLYVESFNRKDHGRGVVVPFTVPPGLARVVLRVFTTGHCTDGRDEDEFVSKANVIAIDGVVVERFHPWRDDCRRYRDRNPYCSRWADGSWSSDYSRSGWCPGVEVDPTEIDVTDHAGAGSHELRYTIEEIRPADADGNYGYWRVSVAAVGWDHAPRLWKN